MSDGANLDMDAIILAAGLSLRMGQPKMLLPWVQKTVLETVVDAVLAGGIAHPIVVAGANPKKISELLKNYPVQIVFNPDYEDGEMLHSLQAGLPALGGQCQAFFVVLGDQPQIQSTTIQLVIEAYRKEPHTMIVPSFQMRRGHPWLVGREFWDELLSLKTPATLRDFVRKHAREIHYLNLDTPTILADLDTPEDYLKFRPA